MGLARRTCPYVLYFYILKHSQHVHSCLISFPEGRFTLEKYLWLWLGRAGAGAGGGARSEDTSMRTLFYGLTDPFL